MYAFAVGLQNLFREQISSGPVCGMRSNSQTSPVDDDHDNARAARQPARSETSGRLQTRAAHETSLAPAGGGGGGGGHGGGARRYGN